MTADEWVEVHRGPRRSAQVIIRALIDAGISARDGRRLGVVRGKAQEGIVQVPAARGEEAGQLVAALRKNFPHVFSAGGKGD